MTESKVKQVFEKEVESGGDAESIPVGVVSFV